MQVSIYFVKDCRLVGTELDIELEMTIILINILTIFFSYLKKRKNVGTIVIKFFLILFNNNMDVMLYKVYIIVGEPAVPR